MAENNDDQLRARFLTESNRWEVQKQEEYGKFIEALSNFIGKEQERIYQKFGSIFERYYRQEITFMELGKEMNSLMETDPELIEARQKTGWDYIVSQIKHRAEAKGITLEEFVLYIFESETADILMERLLG